MIVEIWCKAEKLVIGTVETDGSLNAKAIKKGAKGEMLAKAIADRAVIDGILMRCPRCYEPAWFKSAEGDLVAAVPGDARAKA